MNLLFSYNHVFFAFVHWPLRDLKRVVNRLWRYAMEYKSVLADEKTFLARMLQKIKIMIAKLEVQSAEAEKELDYLCKTLSPEATDYYLILPVAQQLARQYAQELSDITKISSNPYFGKIIFSYDAESADRKLYIGKKGIFDMDTSVDQTLSIIDWRAPIAEVYYNSRLGRTSYCAPDETYDLDLKLKSTLKIRDSELQSIYDVDVVANDQLLVDYLSKNKDTVLNEIIATIQEDQNKIIRKSLKKNIIVQGVAGSGKTTVALHRISYLLYTYKENLTYENVYLIASNALFLHYITSMLPDLDVPVIRQGTMQEILLDTIREYEPNFPQLSRLADAYKDIYQNETFIGRYKSFIHALQDGIFCENDISFLDIILLSGQQIGDIANRRQMTLFEKAQEADALLTDSVKSQKSRIISYMLSNKNADERVISVLATIFKLPSDHIFEYDLERSYGRLLAYYKNYYTRKLKKLGCKRLFQQFTNFSGTHYTLNDLACCLLFLIELKGPSGLTNIRHVVIDEAQDFSTVVYFALRSMLKNATFTLSGDVMQNISQNGLHRWDEIKNEVFDENAEYLELLKSYRNTIEISAFTQMVIEYIIGRPFPIQPVIRHGESVSVHSFASAGQRLAQVEEILKEYATDDGHINAIICKTDEAAAKLYSALNNCANVAMLDANEQILEHKNYIMALKHSKGLEFDGVILWDFDEYSLSPDSLDYKLLYVAMTRALHQLHIFSNNPAVLAFADHP